VTHDLGRPSQYAFHPAGALVLSGVARVQPYVGEALREADPRGFEQELDAFPVLDLCAVNLGFDSRLMAFPIFSLLSLSVTLFSWVSSILISSHRATIIRFIPVGPDAVHRTISTLSPPYLNRMEGFEGFIPFFEEEGMECATYLFLFQDPLKSGVEKSGVVSHTNNDASARMIPPQLEAPRDERESPETVEEAPERVESRSAAAGVQ
jgi:hypothetical protein